MPRKAYTDSWTFKSVEYWKRSEVSAQSSPSAVRRRKTESGLALKTPRGFQSRTAGTPPQGADGKPAATNAAPNSNDCAQEAMHFEVAVSPSWKVQRFRDSQ